MTCSSRKTPARSPVFNPDVRTFEVTNGKTGEVVGLLYLDTYRPRGQAVGRLDDHLPQPRARLPDDNIVLASNNNNFTKPEAGKPILLSLDDAETMFHEFGHAHPLSAGRREISVARRIAARLRRISEPGERELAADPAGAREVRAPLSDRRADAGGAGRQDQEGRHVQPGLRHGRISVVGAGRHEAAPRPRRRGRSPMRSRRRRWPRSACRGKW